jgi:peptide/nickel transport system permease protein
MIVDAIENRDYMLIQGSILFIAFIFVFVNLIVDILYLYVNPKVSYDGEKGGS